MTEYELVELIAYRGERAWVFIQWWASISFALMTASYLGREKLSGVIVAVMLAMYTYTTLVIMTGLEKQSSWVTPAYESLRRLGKTTELSHVSQEALKARDAIPNDVLNTIFLGVGFLFTVGFVCYCWRLRKQD